MERHCDNCSSPLSGSYCARCGQRDRSYRRALPLLLAELVGETLEVDSRVWRTLRLLMFRPGELSRQFSNNRRADYLSPVRLYLFASLTFFFVLSLTAELVPPASQMEAAELPEASASDAEIAALAAVLDEEQRRRLQAILARQDAPLARLAVNELARDWAERPQPAGGARRFMSGLLVDALYEPARTLERLLDKLPVAMFLMLPVYAALLALFYRSRGRYYVEHLVFAVHVHVVTYLVFTVLLVLPDRTEASAATALSEAVENLLLLVLLGYQFLALRRYYGGGYGTTALRLAGLLALYLMLLIPGLAAALLLALTLD